MSLSESFGSLGVSILLIAFILNLLKKLKTDDLIYILLNFTGAGIACYASFLIPFFPFVILEGTWTVLSLSALIKWFIKRSAKKEQIGRPVN